MQAMTLQVVLDGATALYRSINADADYAQAEEEEHGDPFEDSDTCAFALDFCQSVMVAVRTSHLLRALSRPFFRDLLQGDRFILYIR